MPAAIIWFGLSHAMIYTVVLLGAVPSIANGLVSGIDQVPPLFLRVGRVLGARPRPARHVVLPAALPGYLGGSEAGLGVLLALADGRRAHHLLARPRPGSASCWRTAAQLSDMPLVFASIILILVVGVAIELLIFAPLERRVLNRRGLTMR